MQIGAKLSAAIAVLEDFDARRVPLKTALADWARSARYAGAKDRAWISGLCLDALRRRHSLGYAMGNESPRAIALATMRFLHGTSFDDMVGFAAEEPHGPGALSENEQSSLAATTMSTDGGADHIVGDYPEWLNEAVVRAFGDHAIAEMTACAQRADIDLRVNTLKATPEKALAALKTVKGQAAPILENAARIEAPNPKVKAPAITVIPAFNKGWVEVQDLGSQVAACAAGDIKGAQVMDYCAGGGGKTLALGAMMKNSGQLYAYDRDARRLSPLYHRAKRAGLRNLQVINPKTDQKALDALVAKMNVVFVDAPCTGAGTWRRRPDTKWRLTERQMATRNKEQDEVLLSAAKYVKPGGRLVWVTCSFFHEENEDRLAAFLEMHQEFKLSHVMDQITATGLLRDDALTALERCKTDDGSLRMTPHRIGVDGFYVAVLARQ